MTQKAAIKIIKCLNFSHIWIKNEQEAIKYSQLHMYIWSYSLKMANLISASDTKSIPYGNYNTENK